MTEFSDLLLRVRSGDQAARAELYETYRDGIARVARRGLGARLRSRYDTIDITQSVFTDVLGEIDEFEDRGQSAFHAWLLLKVRHKLVDKARLQTLCDGRRREERLDTDVGLAAPGPDPDPSMAASQREDQARLTALLGTLDSAQNAVIGLFVDEGLSWEEIAARLGVPSAAAARMRYVRAIATLRERWTRS